MSWGVVTDKSSLLSSLIHAHHRIDWVHRPMWLKTFKLLKDWFHAAILRLMVVEYNQRVWFVQVSHVTQPLSSAMWSWSKMMKNDTIIQNSFTRIQTNTTICVQHSHTSLNIFCLFTAKHLFPRDRIWQTVRRHPMVGKGISRSVTSHGRLIDRTLKNTLNTTAMLPICAYKCQQTNIRFRLTESLRVEPPAPKQLGLLFMSAVYPTPGCWVSGVYMSA